ncbi:hypothetical protein AYO38_06960 [bacterium SCGC AG-212-C10]|nr:hypothetical protein AYO38_06960 [bacterium SCGC AG-212-C10]
MFEDATRLTLADGETVIIRRIRPDDETRLQAMHRHLSRESVRLRFFTAFRELSVGMAHKFANVDFKHRAAFVVSGEGSDAIVGVGRYEESAPRVAEVAFVMDDAYQGRGIGTVLLQIIADCARTNGFRTLTAIALAENAPMLAVFRDSGFPTTITTDRDMRVITMQIAESPAPL